MTSSQKLKALMDSRKTVFKPQDLRVLWQTSQLNTKISAGRMVEGGLLVRIAWGYYALRDDYDVYELANAVVSPSYVSFNSALLRAGVNYQQRGSVDSVATLGYVKTIRGTRFSYHAMKSDLFFNLEGVLMRGNVSIAAPERAILDSLYFGFMPDIDNADKLDREYLKQLSRLYPDTVKKKARRIYGP